MKINDKILKYLTGDMRPGEKDEFELNLSKDHQLKLELEEYKKNLDYLKYLSVTSETESSYFQNLVPKIRTRLEENPKLSTGKKIAFSLPAIIILGLLFYQQFILSGTNDVKTIQNEIASLNDSVKVELLAGYLGNEKNDFGDSLITNNPEQVFSEEISKEIFRNDFQNVNYESNLLESEDLINDLTNQEAEVVYNGLVNKKII